MSEIGGDVATHVAESLADKAMQELKYLCCYKSYVDDFQDEQNSLSAKRDTVLQDIKEAKDRNEDKIENEVKLWLERADDLIEEDTKGKKKWFGLIPNCFWQYKRGKELEGETQRIKKLIEKSNFPHVARSTGLPGIEFYSSENFLQFKDRKSQSKKLLAALKDDKFMIGLHGLGGTGKTTMAVQVGKEVEKSKVFDKVIFTVVSKDPNLKKIRNNIAKHLNLTFNEGMEEPEQAEELWKRITECEKKVLIVLDDTWEKLTLRDIGIPLGRHHTGCCAILLTTRDWKVCRDMGCHETIELEVLNEKDAVDLFLSYAGQSIDDSSNNFKDVAKGIVKECGRLPVAIVAMASALKSRPLIEWKQGLERLQNPKSIHDVNEDLKEAYNSLRLSYDYLKNEEARKLFLLCSLFPEDYEIPIELLTRIARCLGLCGEANRYSTTRSHFTPIKNVLMDSRLLLKAKNEAVKMHDLIREVALWIGNKLVQVAKDSSTTLIENIQYSSWNINAFPNHFDGRTLEVLLLWISNNADSTTMTVPDGIFEGMEKLKFLALMNRSNIRISSVSLCQSHLSLINVRNLVIKGFVLGDISILANLKRLESLELSNCSMTELPKEITELEKLRLLEIVECDIERNNPFEVIGRCLKLEELYFVSNHMDEDTCKSQPQITTFPEFERFQIKAWHGYSNYEVDFSISRYFDSNEHLEVNFSNKIFKSLVARAEVLELDGNYYNRGWTNVVPEILPVKDDSMEDHLTSLCLQSMNGIECLIHTKHLRSGVAIFSKLVKLNLCRMDVRQLCCGPCPVNFLKQLEELYLSECKNLEGSLFDEKLELCNLKFICLQKCSMTCLFHPFTAQSMKYMVAEPMEDHDPNQKSHDSMFPKLKYLEVESCPELEFIFPICFCKDLPLLESMEIVDCEKLKYIFGQYPEERDLHQMGKEAIPPDEVRKSSTSTKVEDDSSSLSRTPLCWFWPKSNASTISHPSPSMNHNQEKGKTLYNVQELLEFKDLKTYKGFQNLSNLRIEGCKQLKFILSASTSRMLQKLKELHVSECEELVSIIEEDEETKKKPMAPHQVYFPELRRIEVRDCKSMKYLFSIASGKLPRLCYVDIEDTPQLGEVFRRKHGEGQKLVMEDVFPKLYIIRLVNLPALHTICQGIDFHTVISRIVRECPAISLTSANDSLEKLFELSDSFGRNSIDEVKSIHYVLSKSLVSIMEAHAQAIRAAYLFKWAAIPPNLSENEEASKEIAEEDSTTNSNLSNLAESTKTSANEIVEEKLSTTPSSDSDMNLKATVGEGRCSEKYGKASSSKELHGKESMADDQQALGEIRSSNNEAPQRVEELTNKCSSKETSNEMGSAIPLPITGTTSLPPQIATSVAQVEKESRISQSDLSTISAITDQSGQEKIMNQRETSTEKLVKFDQGNDQQFAEDDLMRLFQIIEEGAEMEVHMPHVSKIAAVQYYNELIEAHANLKGSLKMSLNEILSSEESRLRLENALNILSSHCSKDGAPSHGLQATIHTLQQEIQNVLSSSKQAYVTVDTFNKLEHKEKLFIEERSKRKEAAIALLSEICNKEISLAEASLKEAKLKEQISKLQDKLDRKEKQVQEYEMELISLKEQKKRSVTDTMGFINEFEAMKKERSHMVEENVKAKEHLHNMDVKWSSCLSNLKKTTLLVGVYLQQKL